MICAHCYEVIEPGQESAAYAGSAPAENRRGNVYQEPHYAPVHDTCPAWLGIKPTAEALARRAEHDAKTVALWAYVNGETKGATR